jgi:predicted nucleotide-binding protein (sugar kinase/HSP70/actin superfamily)
MTSIYDHLSVSAYFALASHFCNQETCSAQTCFRCIIKYCYHLSEQEIQDFNDDKTIMPMEDEEKMERAKEIMKKMRKCKHHHMEKGMMHRHHEHHYKPREEPREELREEGEEGGFIKQLWNIFNF